MQILAFLFSVDPDAANSIVSNPDRFLEIGNGLQWSENPELARQLQDSVQNSPVFGFCGAENVRKLLILL